MRMRPKLGCRAAAVAGIAGLLGVSTACSVRQAVDVVTAGDPVTAARRVVTGRLQSYARDPEILIKDAKGVRDAFNQLVAVLRGEAGEVWGKDTKTPDRKVYVKYSQSYRSRAIIDFDSGTVRIETLDQGHPEQSLIEAVVVTLLTPDDPRAVDVYSAKPVELGGDPYLNGLVVDEAGRSIRDRYDAERYAHWLWDNALQRSRLRTPRGDETVFAVEFRLTAGHLHAQARRYAGLVEKNAARFGVSSSLIYAVMEVESAFNPFAVSHVPAYGLMQLVPTSGGRDAYRHARGTDAIPGRDFLFEPANNIELGAAYLNLLDSRYLAAIIDPVAREYCVIAAYNGGAGNVFKTFDPDRQRAVEAINRLNAAQVYERLRGGLKFEETRRYLLKVVTARRDYIGQ
ncbi:MAG: DUF3393 domain-containing protein [Gammaproteobacteria bacterium]|nr:DUF3393 domain-containing protein [Gammaproteobacteria bacterium]MCP5135627.1 DUF3393 domain-containing protein [Gammaproteobacteria bacterium]